MPPTIKIFSANLTNSSSSYNSQQLKKLEKEVNAALAEVPGATVQWLQSTHTSSSSSGNSFMGVEHSSTKMTTITAVVTYP
jgi:hypothetical protein